MIVMQVHSNEHMMVVFGNFVLIHSAHSNTYICGCYKPIQKALWYSKITQSINTVTCCYSVRIQT